MTREREDRRPWPARNWGVQLGCTLVIVGAVLLATVPAAHGFGWFAYQPDADFGFVAGPLVAPQGIVGSLIGALGVLTLVAAVGYRIGLRRGRPTGRAERTRR